MSSVGGVSSSIPSTSLASSLNGTNSTGSAGSSLADALNGTSTGSSTGTDLSNALNGSGGSAIGDSTSAALQAISDQIAALSASQQGASDDVQSFDKTTQDVLYDNNATARSIGQLRLNTTRLNVISALSPGDAADVFSFTASTAGQTKLGVLVNDPTNSDPNADASSSARVQVFAQGKGLIADSDPDSGQAYTNYQALQKGTYDMARGQYTVRMSRADGVDPQQKGTFNYALQLSQGTTYTQDFSVTEQAYTPGTDDPFGLGNTGNDPGSILSDAMADSYSFINSLPAIGSSGTDKLLGFIYSAQV